MAAGASPGWMGIRWKRRHRPIRARPPSYGRAMTLAGRKFGSARGSRSRRRRPAPGWRRATLLIRGELVTWMEDAGVDAASPRGDPQDRRDAEVAEDFRCARDDGVEPGDATGHARRDRDAGLAARPSGRGLRARDSGAVPAYLERWTRSSGWRACRLAPTSVRDRARLLDVALDEMRSGSICCRPPGANLEADWDGRRRVFPDTDHPGLLAIMERRASRPTRT